MEDRTAVEKEESMSLSANYSNGTCEDGAGFTYETD